ncbi:MAG: hypothetical protein QW599_05470 [Nitrososphaerota archaeon]
MVAWSAIIPIIAMVGGGVALGVLGAYALRGFEQFVGGTLMQIMVFMMMATVMLMMIMGIITALKR